MLLAGGDHTAASPMVPPSPTCALTPIGLGELGSARSFFVVLLCPAGHNPRGAVCSEHPRAGGAWNRQPGEWGCSWQQKPCTHLCLHAGAFLQSLHSLGKGRAAAWDRGCMLMARLYLQHNQSSSRGQQELQRHQTLQPLPGVSVSLAIWEWRLLGSPHIWLKGPGGGGALPCAPSSPEPHLCGGPGCCFPTLPGVPWSLSTLPGTVIPQ